MANDLVRDPITGTYSFADPTTAVINQQTGETAATASALSTSATAAGYTTPVQQATYAEYYAPTGAAYTTGAPSLTSSPTPTYTAPTTLSSTQLATPTTTNYQTPTTSQPSPTTTYPTTTLTAPDFSLTPTEQGAQDLNTQLQDLNNQLIGKSAYQTQENTLYGVDAAQKTITDLSAQLTGIKNEAAAIPLQLQQGAADRGVTTPVLGQQENSRLRTNAIAALGVSTLLAAAQGQLANAQSLADKAVEQKYGPIEEQIKAAYANLQLIQSSPQYSADQKKQAFEQQQYLTQQAQIIAEQKAAFQQVQNIAIKAASVGVDSQTLQKIQQTTDPVQASYLANQAIQALPSAGTSATGLKILGNSTSGYFTYNPTTGETKPISNPGTVTPSTVTPTTTGSSPSTASSSAYTFTASQLNTGSAKAALSLDQFKALNGDVQNFYVHATAANLTDLQNVISQVQSGSLSPDDAKKAVDGLPLAQSVKEYFKSLIDQAAPQQSTSSTAGFPSQKPDGGSTLLSDIWGGISNFFGF